MSEIADKAKGRWPEILKALGVDERFVRKKDGPCPFCGGKDRYRFSDFRELGDWYCRKCGHGDGFDFLERLNGWGFVDAAKEIEAIIGEVQAKPKRKKKDPSVRLNKIRAGVVKPQQVRDVTQYLGSRGLEVPPGIRAHPSITYYAEQKPIADYPAMLGVVQAPDGTPLTYHVTYLQKGAKAPVKAVKKLLPPKDTTTGGAIRLYPQAEHMGVAEGIETAIAAKMLIGIPTWAVISSSIMQSWQPPEGVKRVTVFGDHDAKFAGQAAAYQLAHRLACEDFAVDVCIPGCPVTPHTVGMDWADWLAEQESVA